MKGFGEINNSKKKKNEKSTFSKEQKIIQAIKFHGQGNILEATKSYKELISQGCKDQRVFSNSNSAILQLLLQIFIPPIKMINSAYCRNSISH